MGAVVVFTTVQRGLMGCVEIWTLVLGLFLKQIVVSCFRVESGTKSILEMKLNFPKTVFENFSFTGRSFKERIKSVCNQYIYI